MPAGGFKTFTAGSVLTASDVNAYLMQGVLVFTNEAARDAAITAPQEGMVAYLTSPSVPAATGGTTALPTGVRTIYNGTNWVCVTPVGAYTSNQGTTTSATFTATLGSGGTNPSVTLVTGTSARVSIAAVQYVSASANSYMGVAVSGAGTVAATSSPATFNNSTIAVTLARTFIFTGLTAGTNTFTLQYRCDGANTGFFQDRGITVEGIA